MRFLFGKRKKRAAAGKYVKLTDEEREMQVMSKAAYSKNSKQAMRKLRKHGMGDYEIDRSNSSKDYRTFVNKKTKKAVVAYRGTSQARDLIPDAGIVAEGLGRSLGKSKRHRQARKRFEKVTSQYEGQGYSTHATGHSLGGSLAEHAAKRTKKSKVTTFNKGIGKVGKKGLGDRHTDIRTKGDLVSGLSKTGKNRKLKSLERGTRNPLKAHGLGIF